jgi:hypothetical protein
LSLPGNYSCRSTIYAGDGHYIEHACHDLRQPLYKNNPYVAIGHFFAINLRTYWLNYLDLAGEGTKKQHDIAVMKKISKQLKVGGKKGALWISGIRRASIFVSDISKSKPTESIS